MESRSFLKVLAWCVTSSWPSVTCMAFVLPYEHRLGVSNVLWRKFLTQLLLGVWILLLLRNQEMYIVGTSSNGTAKNGSFERITDHFQVLSVYPKIWASVLSLPSYIAHRTCTLHTENLRALPVCQVCFLAFAYLLCFRVSVSFIITFRWWGSCLDLCLVLVFVFSSDEVQIFLPCSCPFLAIAYLQNLYATRVWKLHAFRKNVAPLCRLSNVQPPHHHYLFADPHLLTIAMTAHGQALDLRQGVFVA